ncbi:MAG: glycoside hydrolase family 38 C-terminal domain-containing protein, partial [Candidatus Hydrogenedentes bacterium]|nr:glycoside hydrolase family 38 C-terminal domain-containing protein [Candidatus Hydrogenedentota bacterium]
QAGICWRGTQDENYPALFQWVGPDGSRMPTYKLRDDGSYAPFLFKFRNKLEGEELPDSLFKEYFEPYLKEEQERSVVPLVLLLDAIDHFPADRRSIAILKKLQTLYPDVEFVWTSLEEFGREMAAHADAMPERTGELREPCRTTGRAGQYLIVHTISSRYPLKKANDECQALLEDWTEPLALISRMQGGHPNLHYLELAWEYLLKNHPHDSICGCSVDQVHRDMRFRFDQSRMLADGLVRRITAELGQASETDAALANVVVHNPLPYERTGIFDIALPFAKDFAPKYVDGLVTGEALNRFRLVNKNGESIPYQLAGIDHGTVCKRLKANGRRHVFGGDVYHVAVEMTLPACGFTGIRVEPMEESNRNFGSLLTGPMTASTDRVSLSVHPDGTASLTNHATGTTYGPLFLYEDTGDSGDGWTRGPLTNDIAYKSPGTRVTTAVEEEGPLRTVFRIERESDLPAAIERKTRKRLQARISLRVTDRIFVEKDAPYVRVRTLVENTVRDHRLRVLFPTPIATETSFAETPFAVVERTIDIPPEAARWHERVNPETAFTRFFGIQNPTNGLAVLCPAGLHEYEVMQTPERILALTLFRSTYQTVGTPGEPDGQLLEPMEFEYLLYPFSAPFRAVAALRMVQEAQTGIRTHQSENLSESVSFCRLLNNTTVVTALKPAADGNGGVLRLWNPTENPVKESMQFTAKLKTVERCTLDEQTIESVKIKQDGSFEVEVPSKGLTTVRFRW